MLKKRVIFFLPTLAMGGAELVTVNFIKQLNIEKYEVHLVLGIITKEGEHLLPQGVNIHNIEAPRMLFSIFKLQKIINKIQPDVIYSSLNRAHIALYLALLFKRSKPKTVFRIPNSPKLLSQHKQIGMFFNFALIKALSSADKIIAQTPEMKKEITTFYKVPAKKINVIMNPINQKVIDQKKQESITIFDAKYINVVASGRIRYEKGFDTLIKAFKKVYLRNKLFKLYIIGADVSNKQKDYQALIKTLKLEKVVTFVGFDSNPYKYYQACDLFVLSSRVEGLPNTVLENLYLQKPIVATTCIPFMHTLIKDKRNGLLVPVDDVEKLSTAILNYKSIDTSFSTINFDDSESDTLFQFN